MGRQEVLGSYTCRSPNHWQGGVDGYSDGKLLDIFYMFIQRASVDLNFSCPDL